MNGSPNGSPVERFAAHLTTITRWCSIFAAVLALLLPLPVVYEVVMDQLQRPPIWVFEISGYAIIMIAFAASGYGLKTGHHFRVWLLAEKWPQLERPLVRFSGLLEILFGVALIVAGSHQAYSAYVEGLRSDTLIAIPQVWPELAFPLGGFVIALQGIAHVLDPRIGRLHDVVRV